jgi:uncharacterized protein (TIGR02996 family)
VTTEEDFQTALDANPHDWHTRLVFADWLQDRDDPRAEAVRALGRLCAHPVRIEMMLSEGESADKWKFIWGTDENDGARARELYAECLLPAAWYQCLAKVNPDEDARWWRYYDTRRAAEDAAVEGYARFRASATLESEPAPTG